MIILPNPQSKQWSQTNDGDIFGNIYTTKNLNFDKHGYLTLAKRVSYVYEHLVSGSGTGQVYNCVYDPLQVQYAFGTANGVYNTTSTTTLAISRDNTAGNPGGDCNVAYWNSALYAVQNTDVRKRTAGPTWATVAALAPTTSQNHPLCVNEVANELLYGDGNIMRRINTGDTLSTAITLPAQYVIRWIVSSNANIYIGCGDTTGKNGRVFLYPANNSSATATASYGVNAQVPLSGCKYKSTVAIVNSLGQVMEFNGSGFSQLAAFPVYYEPEYWYNAYSFGALGSGGVMPYGMCSEGDLIYINMNNSTLSGTGYKNLLDNMPGGVHCFDPRMGLYHRFAPSPYNDTTDYGQFENLRSGFIAFLAEPGVTGGLFPAQATATSLLFSGQVAATNPGSSSGKYEVICSPTTGNNAGYLITTKIPSSQITDVTPKLYIKFRNVYDSADKIIVKGRSVERNGLPFVSNNGSSAGVTWTSTTTFTSTSTNFANVLVGDDVEIVESAGSGKSASITVISYSNPTYTVTLDTAIGTNTVQGNVLVNNWTLLKTINNTFTDMYAQIDYGAKQKWTQFKIELQGDDVQIEEIQILNTTDKRST